MKIILYQISCGGCQGNHSINKMKQVCKQKGVDFEERRTIFWDRWAKEADEIMKLNPGLKLPFFYAETGDTLMGNSLTPLEVVEKFVEESLEHIATN